MLCLTRKRDEQVVIIDTETGQEVCTVNVAQIKTNGDVRLGFTASKRYDIHRQEYWDSIKHVTSPPG